MGTGVTLWFNMTQGGTESSCHFFWRAVVSDTVLYHETMGEAACVESPEPGEKDQGPPQHPTEFEIQIHKGSLKLLAMATWLSELEHGPGSHVPCSLR